MKVNVNAATIGASVSATALQSVSTKMAELLGTGETRSILGDASVSVSAGGMDLDQLLAELTLEEEERRLKLARERLASALELINAMNEQQGVAHSEAYAKINDYSMQLESVDQQIRSTEQAAAQAQRDVTQAQQGVTQAQKELTAVQKTQAQAQRKEAAAQAEVDQAQAALDSMTQGADETPEAYAQRQAEARATLSNAQAKLAAAQASTASAGQSVAAAEAALASAQSTLDSAQARQRTLSNQKASLETQRTDLSNRIDEQWNKLNDDELRVLLEAMKLDASDVQSILDKEVEERDEAQEAAMAQREAPAKIILKALERYEMRLQDSISEKRDMMI